MILVCEIGDRTFFIAAIMAMHRRRITVWQVGCLGPV
jgi:putative Ca2+/H+ antiporter (TMEM165/GDT1 family)